ncbi:MAG: SHOCT domain-containing protein [Ilumatobacteraceae bacterium]
MIAYDYPLLGVFWSMMIFFLWVAWLILLPFLGVFIYLIVNGKAMGERAAADAQQQQAALDNYVRQTAGTTGSADELAKLAALRDNGTLTDAEFAAQKAKLLDA